MAVHVIGAIIYAYNIIYAYIISIYAYIVAIYAYIVVIYAYIVVIRVNIHVNTLNDIFGIYALLYIRVTLFVYNVT